MHWKVRFLHYKSFLANKQFCLQALTKHFLSISIAFPLVIASTAQDKVLLNIPQHECFPEALEQTSWRKILLFYTKKIALFHLFEA